MQTPLHTSFLHLKGSWNLKILIVFLLNGTCRSVHTLQCFLLAAFSEGVAGGGFKTQITLVLKVEIHFLAS